MLKKTGNAKVWITKYALSKGILHETVEMNQDTVDGRIVVFRWVHRMASVVPNSHWFNTREEAVRKAGEMRAKKIKSLRKQIAKLENLQIQIHEEE